MKKLNHILNIIIGAFVGVFIGHGIYVYWDFKTHPDLYAVRSAPWYTSILVYAGQRGSSAISNLLSGKLTVWKYGMSG